jgi:beta-N-acetylhexosaminidase
MMNLPPWQRAVLLVLWVWASMLAPVVAQQPVTTPQPPVTPSAAVPSELSPDDTGPSGLDNTIAAYLAQMTPEDRVGQLFLVGFPGNQAPPDSEIVQLIYQYRIGGVIMSPAEGNIANERVVDTPRQVAMLVNQLQGAAYGVLLGESEALLAEGTEMPPPDPELLRRYNLPPLQLPLFIAVEHLGDGVPAAALRRGFTPIPSQMALGATWNQDLTRKVGQIVGRELEAVGVNLLLGPNLDVFETPRTDALGSMALRSFGGNSHWVSQLGRAYIGGVHEGGQGRVAAVARHFPGAADVDRMLSQEVATVQRPLAQLERVSLPPFWAVTRNPSIIHAADGELEAADGLMSSHTRYSGFQGSSLGRNTPLSLAPELSTVLQQQGFADWRARGGLMVSSPLGSQAVRRFYSPSLEEFPYRRIALDAFTAGHDLLILQDFSLDDRWESEKRNIEETILFFLERYLADSDFAQQVDSAVARILWMKLRLYGAAGTIAGSPGAAEVVWPALADVLVRPEDLSVLTGEARASALATMGQVARESITVLYPDPATASELLAIVPQADDQILIITDSRLVRECDQCIAEAAIGPDGLANIMTRLYGVEGTGQLSRDQIVSITFADLAQYLGEPTGERAAEPTPVATPSTSGSLLPTPEGVNGGSDLVGGGAGSLLGEIDEPIPGRRAQVEQLVQEADWLIFAMLDVDSIRYPHSDAVKRFLSQRSDQYMGKHLVVLAFQGPNFLDATEISKLNGYYGIFSKTQPSLESTVRAIFRAYTPVGAPPVSVPGTRFANLPERLQPDPARTLNMRIFSPEGELLVASIDSGSAPLPQVNVDSRIRVQVGPIYDINGKPLHDGSLVEIVLSYDGDDGSAKVESARTRSGTAVQDIVLDRSGLLQVTARVGALVYPTPFVLNVTGPVAEVIADPAPTPAAVALVEAAVVESPAVTVPEAAPVMDVALLEGARTTLVSLFVTLLTISATLSLLFIAQVRVLPRRTLVHSMLWALNCGLVAYVLYSLGMLPGAGWLHDSLRIWGAAIVVFIAMLPPLIWLQLRTD